MKTIFKLLVVALLFASCDDVEPTIYNGNIEQNDTFLSFSRSVYLLPVVQNQTGEVKVVFNSSTASDVDRVYNIEVGFPESSPANPATFTVPASVTIPAGEYQGSFTIPGVDNDLVDEVVKRFTLTVTNLSDNEYLDSDTVTVNIYEVCPLQADFLGDYAIQVTSEPLGIPAFEAGVVTLVEGDSQYERVFNATVYPGYGGNKEVTLAFACNFVNLGQSINTNVTCDVDDDTKSLVHAPAELADRSAYNTNDDSYFELTFIEDSQSDCGSPANTVLTFTKVE